MADPGGELLDDEPDGSTPANILPAGQPSTSSSRVGWVLKLPPAYGSGLPLMAMG